jgi:hypothetical protein
MLSSRLFCRLFYENTPFLCNLFVISKEYENEIYRETKVYLGELFVDIGFGSLFGFGFEGKRVLWIEI